MKKLDSRIIKKGNTYLIPLNELELYQFFNAIRDLEYKTSSDIRNASDAAILYQLHFELYRMISSNEFLERFNKNIEKKKQGYHEAIADISGFLKNPRYQTWHYVVKRYQKLEKKKELPLYDKLYRLYIRNTAKQFGIRSKLALSILYEIYPEAMDPGFFENHPEVRKIASKKGMVDWERAENIFRWMLERNDPKKKKILFSKYPAWKRDTRKFDKYVSKVKLGSSYESLVKYAGAPDKFEKSSKADAYFCVKYHTDPVLYGRPHNYYPGVNTGNWMAEGYFWIGKKDQRVHAFNSVYSVVHAIDKSTKEFEAWREPYINKIFSELDRKARE